MANRRMFSREITESDRFTDLSVEARCLYFSLSMNADDDGFIVSPRRVCRSCAIEESFLQELSASGFIITFDSGVVVITDWLLNNHIRKDRHVPTNCKEYSLLQTDGKKYFLADSMATNGCQMVYPVQNSTEQNSLVQNRLVQNKETVATNGCQMINQEYTSQELMEICDHEHIKLSPIQIAMFTDEMIKNDWQYKGHKIGNIGAVLRDYSKTQRLPIGKL